MPVDMSSTTDQGNHEEGAAARPIMQYRLMIGETKRPVGRPPNTKIVRLMQKHGCSRATAYRIAARKPRMRVQSAHSMKARGLDAYFTPAEATISLLYLERQYLPRSVWDPFAGDGAITTLMAQHGYEMWASDIRDYGLAGCLIADYRTVDLPDGVQAIVSNPPYAWALEFAERAISQVGYVAFLLRSNFLIEAGGRDRFFEEHPVTRVYHSSQRLPRMHRFGWTGKRTSSLTPYSWAVWDRRANQVELPRRFRWRDIWAEYQAEHLDLGPCADRNR